MSALQNNTRGLAFLRNGGDPGTYRRTWGKIGDCAAATAIVSARNAPLGNVVAAVAAAVAHKPVAPTKTPNLTPAQTEILAALGNRGALAREVAHRRGTSTKSASQSLIILRDWGLVTNCVKGYWRAVAQVEGDAS